MRLARALPLLALMAAPGAAAGQGLAERITGGGDGVVRMGFPARPGVGICAEGFRLFGDRTRTRGRGPSDASCAPGPVVLEVRVRDAQTWGVDVLDLDDPRDPGARDLGSVRADEAAAFLLDVARGSGGRAGVEDAILPALMADVPDAWRDVLRIAEDRGVDPGVRRSALFWVGQEAAEAATQGLAEVASDEDEDQEVREAAVFALSQRPESEGVSVLMEVARTAREPSTRRAAFFWLAQSRDERVTTFFRRVLAGSPGG